MCTKLWKTHFPILSYPDFIPGCLSHGSVSGKSVPGRQLENLLTDSHLIRLRPFFTDRPRVFTIEEENVFKNAFYFDF
jgi:hypothetical protein